MLCIRFKFKVKLGLVKPGLRLKPGLTKPVFVHTGLRPICTESFKPGLSLKPGLKPEKGLKSYAYHKT